MIFNIVFGIWIFFFISSLLGGFSQKLENKTRRNLTKFNWLCLAILTIMAIISKLA